MFWREIVFGANWLKFKIYLNFFKMLFIIKLISIYNEEKKYNV